MDPQRQIQMEGHSRWLGWLGWLGTRSSASLGGNAQWMALRE